MSRHRAAVASEPGLMPAQPLRRANGLLYRQLATALRDTIENGGYRVGQALPTESALARGFGVSLITVRQALRELEGEGLVRKRAAKTAVITAPPPSFTPPWDLNSFADIAANTRDGRLVIRSYRKERSPLARRVFGLAASDPCYCLRGVLSVRGEAMSQITIFFPPPIGSRLSRADFDDVVVFRSLERHLGIEFAGARSTLRAELADAELARELDYAEGAPVLTMELIYRSHDQQPVELTIARHRADRFSITFEVPNRRGEPRA